MVHDQRRNGLVQLLLFGGIRRKTAIRSRVAQLLTHVVQQQVGISPFDVAQSRQVAGAAAGRSEQLASAFQVRRFVLLDCSAARGAGK